MRRRTKDGRARAPLGDGALLAGTGLVLMLCVLAFPLLFLLVGSLVGEADLFGRSPLWGSTASLEHYRAVLARPELWLPLRNSVVVAGATTVLCITLGASCAYALARLRFRGRNVIVALVLAVAMFPQIAILSPLYLLLRQLRLIDTYPGLVLPYLTFSMPLTVWMLTSYFRELPFEVEEAALLEGAGRLRVLREIVAPVALPGIATTAVLTFLYCWNEFLFALAFTLGPEHRTVPVAIALLRGHYQVPWGQILAATVLVSLPVAILVLAFQRRVVAGLASGAVKG